MRNKINTFATVGIMLLAVMACSFSTANLSDIKLGTDKSASNPKTTFAPQDEIYAVSAVNNAGGKHKAKMRLLFDNVEGATAGTVAYKIETEIEVEDSREVYFNFSIPSGFVPGTYKVELVLVDESGKELDRKTAGFTVSGNGSAGKR